MNSSDKEWDCWTSGGRLFASLLGADNSDIWEIVDAAPPVRTRFADPKDVRVTAGTAWKGRWEGCALADFPLCGESATSGQIFCLAMEDEWDAGGSVGRVVAVRELLPNGTVGPRKLVKLPESEEGTAL